MKAPAYYAATGTRSADLLSLLHVPYTLWHLSYVAIGAGLAPAVDGLILAGTLLAFFFGLGIGAHAFDELHSRPLRTSLSGRTLLALGLGGMAVALAVAILGAVIVSPLVLGWAALGIFLAVGYALEWPPLLHTPLGFALAWGAFPTLVGYWAQTQRLGAGALLAAAAMTLLSLAQRALSTPARELRRKVDRAELVLQRGAETETWSETRVLSTWERPLQLLSAATAVLAIALLATK